MQRFPAAAKKTTTIYNGIDRAFFCPAADAKRGAIHDRLGLGSAPYFLYLGAITPRKNLEVVLRGFRMFLDRTGQHTRLVIAGMMRTPDYGRKLVGLTKTLELNANVCFAGFVTDAECLTLLQQASLFLAPSLGEGFDLPPLEAVACGVAVLASDIDVHRELIPDASLLFAATEPAALAGALEQFTHDAKARLISKLYGARSLAKCDWAHMAQQVAAVYRQVAGKTP